MPSTRASAASSSAPRRDSGRCRSRGDVPSRSECTVDIRGCHPAKVPERSNGTLPTLADVDAIAAGSDPVLRNLQITLSYSDLSIAIAVFMPVNAGWCTVATWASKQAGVTIRNEDLLDIARARLEESTGFLAPIERVIALVGG